MRLFLVLNKTFYRVLAGFQSIQNQKQRNFRKDQSLIPETA
ncbi:hypothetical protein LEP1GSC165_0259 [Leptospira santarosai str. CBC523]|nr:hypothetical protein LEP1GSC165_0259 [Leptospira santarosai str. CBC523]